MKTYYQLTEIEKEALTKEELPDLCRITAIAKGIKTPIPYSEKVQNAGPFGYRIDTERRAKVWEIVLKNDYSGFKGTGISFKTEKQAEKFISNKDMIFVREEGYSETRKTVFSDDADISHKVTYIGNVNYETYGSKLVEIDNGEEEGFNQEDWDIVCKEILEDFTMIRQDIYDKQVAQDKRVEYLRLAGGDETIAKAFWGNTEKGDFPELSNEDT